MENVYEMIKRGGTLDFHTHPYDGDIRPSPSDMSVMRKLEKLTGQETSKIISTDGQFSTFNKDGVITTGVVSRKLGDDYVELFMSLID